MLYKIFDNRANLTTSTISNMLKNSLRTITFDLQNKPSIQTNGLFLGEIAEMAHLIFYIE